MRICKNCGSEQQDGNFCGKCGAQFNGTVPSEMNVSHEETAATQTEQAPVQNSEQLEKIKEQSKQYVGYFIEQLKSPSSHLSATTNKIKYSLMNMVLYILVTTVALFTLLKKITENSYFGYVGPSFIQLVLYASIFFVLIVGINLIAIWVTSKLFSEDVKFTVVLARILGFFVIPIVFSLIGLLMVLLNSYTIASMILYIGLIIANGIIPIFVMMKQLHDKSKNIDRFYAVLLYLLLTVIMGLIVGFFIADSTIGEYLTYL